MTQNTTQSYRFPGSPIAPAAGWFAAANVSDWDVRHFRLHDDARHFQGGIPNLVGIVDALAGIDLIEQIGRPFIERCVRELTTYAMDELGKIGVVLWTPRPSGERAGGHHFLPDRRAHEAALAAQEVRSLLWQIPRRHPQRSDLL